MKKQAAVSDILFFYTTSGLVGGSFALNLVKLCAQLLTVKYIFFFPMIRDLRFELFLTKFEIRDKVISLENNK